MSTGCYACEQSTADAPFRERFVRRGGWRVAHEAEEFAHLHVHVVPRMNDQPDDRKGPAVFGYLRDGHALPSERRDEIAAALLTAWPA